MAVYSPVAEQDLVEFLRQFPVGELRSFEGIESGIENTNYFVDTDSGRYVLTLFERLSADQLPFYLELMHHLAKEGLPSPDPVRTASGELFSTLESKPTSLVTCLPGKAQMQPGPTHCAAIGTLLAKMHLGSRSFDGNQQNLRGLPWWRETIPGIVNEMTGRSRQMLEDEFSTQATFADSAAYNRLPRGAVHADLFRDNVLFVKDDTSPQVGGVIDFYFAGIDTWMYDLAVTVNDWCVNDSDGSFDSERLTAMLLAYGSVRPVSGDEQLAFPYALRASALRFWISRLDDIYSPRPAQMLTPKDPTHFERILNARRQDAVTVGQALIARAG